MAKNKKLKALIQLIDIDKDKVINLSKNEPIKLKLIVDDIVDNEKQPIKEEETHDNHTMKNYIDNLQNDKVYYDKFGIMQNLNTSDIPYSQLSNNQSQQLGIYNNSFTNKWTNDYVLLDTDKWRPPCITYKCNYKKDVSPSLTKGYPVNVKDFDISRRIMQADNINVDYIKERLNQV